MTIRCQIVQLGLALAPDALAGPLTGMFATVNVKIKAAEETPVLTSTVPSTMAVGPLSPLFC